VKERHNKKIVQRVSNNENNYFFFLCAYNQNSTPVITM